MNATQILVILASLNITAAVLYIGIKFTQWGERNHPETTDRVFGYLFAAGAIGAGLAASFELRG